MKPSETKPPRHAFTLVELLVVIGIIGLLLSLLLPSLSRARQQALVIACESNLHNIGVAINQYIAENRGVFPPSNYYKGLGYDPVNGQVPTQPYWGYVHWSSFLYGRRDLLANNATYTHSDGWAMFRCPALQNGGAPPANTYSGNSDGLSNENSAIDSTLLVPQPPNNLDLVDYQAPRISYTLNEAICPRGIFQRFFSSYNNQRIYKFVQASRVKDSSNVVLAAEISGSQAVNTTTSLIDGATPVSGSRRPVNGISATRTGNQVLPDKAYLLLYTKNFAWANLADLNSNPEVNLASGGTSNSTLDRVGRNHGSVKIGVVAGDPLNRGNWDLRTSNFLFVDGHVENKHVTETVYPLNQWGGDFYTLDK